MKLSEQVKQIGERFLNGQYKKAVKENGDGCFYRSGVEGDNRQCAFGRLITDEEFKEILDSKEEVGEDFESVNGISVVYLIEEFESLSRFDGFQSELFNLQVWHDSLHFVDCVPSPDKVLVLNGIVDMIAKKELDKNLIPV